MNLKKYLERLVNNMAERNLNFDEIINRKIRIALNMICKRRGMPEDVLPLWIADMDFKTSSYVEDAVIERVNTVFSAIAKQEKNILRLLQDG